METPEYELDFKIVSHQELTSLDKQDKAVRIIQRAWRRFLDISVFQHLKKIINIRRQGDPHQIMRYINPKEADLIDAAAGIIVRFRFAGVKFPPHICYKIFTHRHIEDLCANSPRDYTKLPPKHTSHCKSNNIQEDDESGWYHRTENNGWRPVSDTFWTTENVTLGDKKEIKFQFSKLMKRKDVEKRRKIRKIEWMRQMYYAGSLEAKSTNHETLGLIHTATKGLIRAIEDGGIDSVMEWEVDEILNWTNTLNFDEYIATWKEIATSNSSDNFKGFSFGQTEEKTYENEMEASDGYANAYVRPCFPKLTPESVYDCKI